MKRLKGITSIRIKVMKDCIKAIKEARKALKEFEKTVTIITEDGKEFKAKWQKADEVKGNKK